MSKHPTPTPVVTATVCSMCGLDWERHGADPTTEDCIRLLKAEIAHKPITLPTPWMRPVPYVPWTPPHRPGPIWQVSPPTITCDTTSGTYTPRAATTTCKAVAA